MNIYDSNLEKNKANYFPLTPISFIERTAKTQPHSLSIIYEKKKFTWLETFLRCKKIAKSLINLGVKKNQTISVIAPNIPEMVELHFAIPMAGCVINAINTRLNTEVINFILEHGEAKVLFMDTEYASILKNLSFELLKNIKVIFIADENINLNLENSPDQIFYSDLLNIELDGFEFVYPDNEWDAIALSYTSGTTGNPKGVVTHHRGAYLNALSNIISWEMSLFSRYLWTLPLFHCNGWCFPWSLAAIANVNICLRNVRFEKILENIKENKVTHYCGAPIVHNLILSSLEKMELIIDPRIKGMVAGAAPPKNVFINAAKYGIDLTHVYGLTETYGPAALCEKKPDWDLLSIEDQAALNSRQGVNYLLQQDIKVLNNAMEEVPYDGQTMGEICFRGNITMKGYLKNKEATNESFKGGWFHSGDLGVVDQDGYLKIKDRSKDIIISGGENISTLELEDVLTMHPLIHEVAVVAKKDDKWGEVPCAFISLKDKNTKISKNEMVEFCASKLAKFKVPKYYVFTDIEKTPTGKIQKHLLRQKADEIK